MKKRVVSFIISSLLGVSAVHAFDYDSKTFLMPRAAGVNKAMEQSTWHDHVYTLYRNKAQLKSHFQITPFFQESINRNDIGKYFGIKGRNNFTVGKVPAAVGDPTPDLDSHLLIHDSADASTEKLAGTVTFRPYQQTYGARLDFVQMINSPINHLFFKASMPLVNVTNNMSMHIANDKKVTIQSKATDEATAATLETKTFSLSDFFTGNVSITAGNDQQSPLTKAKIDGKHSKFGIADLDLAIGYIPEHTSKRYVSLNIGLTIPTGNRVRGEHLFEAVCGNGHHVGLGAGLDAGLCAWKGEHGEVWIESGINYRYLFEATEARTIGVKDLIFGHYQLGGFVGQINKPLFPLANVLTRNLRVKPGSQIDSIVDLSFKTNQFIVDLGYNFYWKDKESLAIKDFNSGSIGVADPRYVQTSVPALGAPQSVPFVTPSTVNDAAGNPVPTITRVIQTSDLDIEAAKTPSQVTHKVFGGFGYKFNIAHDYPTTLALGASYEFSQDNAVLDQYAFWIKAAFSF